MRLELTLEEALAFQRAAAPLPGEIERLGGSGDTLVVDVNPREHLPRFLQAVSPTVTLLLSFERFEAGRAAFRVRAALKSFPLTALTQLLLRLVSLPALRGVEIENRDDELRLWLDVQQLVAAEVAGVQVSGLEVRDGRFVLELEVGEVRLLRGGP